MINVTKSFLPSLKEYTRYLEGIWERGHLTNHGPLVNDLEEKLKAYLGVKHFFFLNNGTVALQIAIRAMDLKGEIITTPFSYVATTSSIVWEQATPVFADINATDFTIDTGKIESAITERTSGILATHVYGIPCAVDAIKKIAVKHKLKVIYDAAHAFGVEVNGKGIMNYGDASAISFHATKLFHTIEGGGIATNDDTLAHRIGYMRNFGHKGQEDFWGMGINAKNSEFHAAMGLCVYPHIKDIIAKRKEQSDLYDTWLAGLGKLLKKPLVPNTTNYNFAYYPVVFETEKRLLEVRDALNASYIYPRRYFYPSLNRLSYVAQRSMPVAESIAASVLCLPMYHDLTPEQIKQICSIITGILKY
jgi:dTDP-4-amino-4,6-dideoxygalactose transaminase